MARIRAVLRRYRSVPAATIETLTAGGIELDPATGIARRKGELVALTAMEFQILELLMRSAGRIVSRDEVSAVLYQRKATPYERSLDVHVSHLRKKIEQEGPQLIRAIRGTGYVFMPEKD
jgi:two-component system response regulator CpxR